MGSERMKPGKFIQVEFIDRAPAVEYCNRLLARGYDAKITEKISATNKMQVWEVYAVSTPYMRRALRP